MKAPGNGPGRNQPKSSVIKVSKDRWQWTEIDRRGNSHDLNGYRATGNFQIQHVSSEGFRFFRLRQIGPNHAGNYYLTITALEIFGVLSGEKSFLFHTLSYDRSVNKVESFLS